MKASKHYLFHCFLNQMKKLNVKNKKIMVACSGGLDSLVLLDLMVESESLLQLKICIAYVHHGNSYYRDLAQVYVHLMSLALGKTFMTNSTVPVQKNLSEAQMRDFRYECFQNWMTSSQSNELALAHTADDLLETRLMRMIRGTGAEGLVSMKLKENYKLRPLLSFTRKELQTYAVFRKITPLEDPTNKQTHPLRNWIRQKWLKQLEKRQSKSIQNLSRSLEKIAEMVQSQSSLNTLSHLWTPQGLDKQKLIKLSGEEQRLVLAQYMKALNLRNYRESHIQELLKNLYTKNRKIKILGRTWSIHHCFYKSELIFSKPTHLVF